MEQAPSRAKAADAALIPARKINRPIVLLRQHDKSFKKA
jgi:hypothetical protein